ncbi:hypothetical protein MVES1_001958 [Malassezia vespertilionis]|uniref:Uncharacterized protein n=1 Tax=Malassezia vespertilionis TaxID=2020962 RepID=A0A2N1JCK0_9BASI|nr:uncharacterized protein MVES1_001958 [Malassezia vespertilionis]PKI84269.1 hypothetical protein MVES_001853 [Malassezia vespertilionis]WFD06605.1 hypothetical protein MVES1_001958 [Malassezia vespertilionis]
MAQEQARLAFDEISETLHTRGYHKDKISTEGLGRKQCEVLTHVLRALLAERDEEAAVRERLLTQNRALENSVDRSQKFVKQSKEKNTALVTKLSGLETQLQQANAALANEQATHRATREQLNKARSQSKQVRLAAIQHRAATDRRSERVRERMAAMSMANTKSLVPDIRIASPAFATQASTAEDEMADAQLGEAEKRNASLLEFAHALKQLVLDSLHSMQAADARLQKIIEVEMPDGQALRRSHDVRTKELRYVMPAIFPPLHPLVTDDTEETHPARKALWTLTRSLQEHVAQLSQWTAANHVWKEYTPWIDPPSPSPSTSPSTSTSASKSTKRARISAS